jgi:hypothetical protein
MRFIFARFPILTSVSECWFRCLSVLDGTLATPENALMLLVQRP